MSPFHLRIPKHKSTVLLQIYFFCVPFENFLTGTLGSALRYIGVLAIIVAIYDVISSSRHISLPFSCVLLLLWLIWSAISYFWCVNTEQYTQYYMMYLRNALLLLTVAIIHYDSLEYNRMVTSYFFGAMLFAMYIIVKPNVMQIDAFSGRRVVMTNSGLFDPNYMASVLIVPIIWSIEMITTAKSKLFRGICLFAFILMSAEVLLSGSRGGFLAIIGAITAYLWLISNTPKKRFRLMVTVTCIVIVIPFLFALLPESIRTRYSIESLTGRLDGGANRLVLWEIGIQAIKQNPLFGYGSGVVRSVIRQYGFYKATVVHNTYLSLMIENGAIGFFIFFMFLLRIVLVATRNKDKLTVSAHFGVMITCFFLDAVTAKFFWAAMTLFVIANNVLSQANGLTNP